MKLAKDNVKEISDMVPTNDVAGLRIAEMNYRSSWGFTNTRPMDCKI